MQLRVPSPSVERPAPVRALPPDRSATANIDWQLEDQAFKHLMPREYKNVSRLVNRKRAKRESYTKESAALLKEALEDAGINASVCGRTKHLYSIYRKLKRYHACGRKFRDIYDLTALRVIVDSVVDCYLVLGVVHGKWRPLVGEFDDYIASPKENRYQSLHTSVIGPEGHPLEVQIRTKEMHRIAEAGVAAHASYKHPKSHRRRNRLEQKPGQLLFEQQRDDEPGLRVSERMTSSDSALGPEKMRKSRGCEAGRTGNQSRQRVTLSTHMYCGGSSASQIGKTGAAERVFYKLEAPVLRADPRKPERKSRYD